MIPQAEEQMGDDQFLQPGGERSIIERAITAGNCPPYRKGPRMPEPQSAELNPEIRRLVDAARGAWTRRLIDHSRANSLLFFRDLKVGTLDLTKDVDAINRLIAGNALHVEDLIPKPKPGGNPNLLPEAPPEHPPEHPPGHTIEHATDEKARSEARKRVKSGLIALQRKALSNLEEKGIETLHLAMGMATWPASDGGKGE